MNGGPLSGDNSLALSARERIDQVCLAFEDAWKRGETSAIEPLLESAAAGERASLLHELLWLELEYRVRKGEQPTREEYLTRFAEFATVVASVFDEQGSSLGSTHRRGLADTIAPASDSTSAAVVFRPGDKIGRYRVERWLDGGAFGSVYLAEDEDLKRLVAIKVPRFDHELDEEKAQRFVDEARTVAKLKHPGIVPIYDVGRTKEGRLFVVMEYMEGSTLKGLLEKERITPFRTAELLADIAEAVGYAHRQGFVHRDLKPANILLDERGRPRVVDFGLAVHESEQQWRAGEFAGTLPYMSPEQVRGESHRLDGRADIWALGIMLYQMLVGRVPFHGDSKAQLSDEIQHREAKPPRQVDDQIPPPLERIWQRCCAKQVADRYSTAGDLAADLRKFLHESQPSAIATSPASRDWKTPVVVGGVLLAVGLASAAIIVANRGAWRNQNTLSAPPLSGESSTGTTAPDLECQLDVLIWNNADSNRRGIGMREPGALPLQEGDQIRIQASLSRPAYVYLVWIDSEGIATPIYPWTIGKWNELPKVESRKSELSLPAAGEGWPMRGSTGMETLVLLARDTPLPRDLDLAALFVDLPRQEMQDARSLVWFINGQTLTQKVDAKRGPSFFDPQKLNDPVLQTQRQLGERLKSHFSTIRAASFAKLAR